MNWKNTLDPYFVSRDITPNLWKKITLPYLFCDIQCPDVTVDDLANSLVDDDVLVFHIYKLYIFVYLFILSTSYIQYSLCIIYRGHNQESFILFYILEEYISRSRSSSITVSSLELGKIYFSLSSKEYKCRQVNYKES